MTDHIHAGLTDEGTYNPNDVLFAGDFDAEERKETLISGQNLKRGALLGLISASGKATVYASGASDGSETAYAVLANDTDASGGDEECIVYVRGTFSEQEIIAQTAGLSSISAALRDECRGLGIYFRNTLRG